MLNYKDDIYVYTDGDVQDCLEQIELNQNIIKSNFADDEVPGTNELDEYVAVGFMRWGDEENKLLRIFHPDYDTSLFDSSKEELLGLMFGDENQKIYVYRNDTMNGWVIDSNVTDVLMGIESSAPDGTYEMAGGKYGSWVTSTQQHKHRVLIATAVGTSSEKMFDENGDEIDVPWVDVGASPVGYTFEVEGNEDNGYSSCWDWYTSTSESQQTGEDDYRPSAAVGTIQYIQLILPL